MKKKPHKTKFVYWRVLVLSLSCLAVCTFSACSQSRKNPPSNTQESTENNIADNQPAITSNQKSLRPLGAIPGWKERTFDVTLADVTLKVDPLKDLGWETEAFNEVAGSQLKALGKLFADREKLTSKNLSKFISDSFQCPPLRPKLTEVFQDQVLVISREVQKSDKTDPGSLIHQGAQGLAVALQDLLKPFGRAKDIHAHFKIIHVELTEEHAETSAYVEINGSRDGGIAQQNTTWHCLWEKPSSAQAIPRLVSIRSENFEEVLPGPKGRRLFTDCTESVLGKTPAFRDQLIYGSDHWYGNFDVAFGIHQGNQGIALGDADGDGLEDLYVCQPAGLPNRFFLQQPDGTLVEKSTELGVDWLDNSHSALFLDMDNDGDADLLVALSLSIAIHENDGTGGMTLKKIVDTQSQLSSMVSADFDNDGDLDIYACGYTLATEAAPEDIFVNPVPYHDANNGGPNFLLRNNGDFNFEDVTAESGLHQNNRRFSFAAACEDYDNDGDIDLYVANDFGRNNLYRNDKGRFVDVAAEAGVEDIAAGMSVSWADYNDDGLMDLYISNMFSSAGNRITYQRSFRSNAETTLRNQLQRHARGNSLFLNAGDGTFRDVSVEEGVTMGRWAWGSLFVDINNDSREDLYVTNGFYTTQDSGDL